MPNRTPIFRPIESDHDWAVQTREITERACELLKQPVDTFLGRKTHDPFLPDDEPA